MYYKSTINPSKHKKLAIIKINMEFQIRKTGLFQKIMNWLTT